jgi:hypothetical protein
MIILTIIAVLNLLGLLYLARAVNSLRDDTEAVAQDVTYLEDRVINRINALAKLIANFHDMNLSAHRVTRRYIGSELLIGKVLPAVGYEEPVRTEAEQALIAQIGQEMSEAAAKQSQ